MKFLAVLLLSAICIGCIHRPTTPHTTLHSNPSKAAQINLELAQAYVAAGQSTRAEQKYLKALEQNPELHEATLGLAAIYQQTQRYQAAEDIYLQLLTKNYKPDTTVNRYAALLCQQQHIEKATQVLESAVNSGQVINQAAALTNAAICLKQHESQWPLATKTLINALEYNNSYPEALLELAELYIKQQEHFEGSRYLQLYQTLGYQSALSTQLTRQLNALKKDNNARDTHGNAQ